MAEHTIGAADDFLQDGEMARLELEDLPVVVARVDGAYYAFGGKCTHYGAPLETGLLKGYSLICPWHHACFDIRSGARIEPPAYNDIPQYECRVEDGQIIVRLPRVNEAFPRRDSTIIDKTFVIVGGGAAGNEAAEELRRNGFGGSIIMVSESETLPVDRPNLSKDYLNGHAKPEWIPLRGESFYEQQGIDLWLRSTVRAIDPNAHSISLAEGGNLTYDKLLLATGGSPRRLNVPGADLGNIFTLRSLADADAILAVAAAGARAVVVGASFIGMEVAFSLASGTGAKVTVVEMEAAPFARTLGAKVGTMYQALHEENGVSFRLGVGVTGFDGDGNVSAVKLDSGEMLPADLVVLGVGVSPATHFITGIDRDMRDGSVLVNAQLQTSHPDIFAAGDIARWNGIRVEHWRSAQQQGMVAAHNMLGGSEAISDHVPFFWTGQWKLSLRYVGHASEWDEIIYRGDPKDRDFIAFYVLEGKLVAAASCKHDSELLAIEYILRDGIALSMDQMRNPDFDLIAHALEN